MAPIRANNCGLTNSHSMCHLNSGAVCLDVAATGMLLFTSASQWATEVTHRAETVSTAGPRIYLSATLGCLVGLDRQAALWERLQKRLTAFLGCCE